MEEKAEKACERSARHRPTPAPSSTSAEDPPSSSKKYKLWENLSESEEESDEPVPQLPVAVTQARVLEALRYYWDSPRISQADDPYAFWRQNSHEYPEVFLVAKATFSCPSGSVDSERLFSVAGDIINVRRTKLTPINAEDQIFLAKNLPYFEYSY